MTAILIVLAAGVAAIIARLAYGAVLAAREYDEHAGAFVPPEDCVDGEPPKATVTTTTSVATGAKKARRTTNRFSTCASV